MILGKVIDSSRNWVMYMFLIVPSKRPSTCKRPPSFLDNPYGSHVCICVIHIRTCMYRWLHRVSTHPEFCSANSNHPWVLTWDNTVVINRSYVVVVLAHPLQEFIDAYRNITLFATDENTNDTKASLSCMFNRFEVTKYVVCSDTSKLRV